MMQGYIDESGSPGIAQNSNDFFIVSLVLFPDELSAENTSAAIDRLRKRLKRPAHYEFHCSHNSNSNQAAFLKLLPNLDFKFISIAIKKNHSRRYASYSHLVELLVREIKIRHIEKANIKIDSNPTLFAELKKQVKLSKLSTIKIKEVRSHSENLIQLADYVVNLSSKKVRNTSRSIDWYRPIAKKQLTFIEVSE